MSGCPLSLRKIVPGTLKFRSSRSIKARVHFKPSDPVATFELLHDCVPKGHLKYRDVRQKGCSNISVPDVQAAGQGRVMTCRSQIAAHANRGYRLVEGSAVGRVCPLNIGGRC